MINFYESNLTDILPENMKYTPECVALGYALQKANQRLIEAANRTSVFSVIETLPERILDALAVELRTQYYDETLPLSVKQGLVKGTMVWYNKAGTVSAVQEMIDKVFNSGYVLEWYETGGQPGTFQISTSALITPELITQFSEAVKNVKNVRSHLADIVTANKATFTIRTAMGVCTHKVVRLT